MASPTWLGQEPTSTSQASSPDLPSGRQSTAPSTPTAAPASVVGIPSLKDANGSASDSTKLPPAKSVAASGYVATPPSFSYVVPPFVNTSSGSSQQASSSPDVKSNSVGSSVFLQPPALSLSASSGPFSYNTSHSGIPVPGGHQFPPNMNATDQVAQGSSVSSAPPVSHSFSQPALSTSTVTSSTFNSGTPTFWMPSAPTFQVPPAGFRNPVTGNPGIITLPSSSNTGVQSASLDSSQSAHIGPMIPATLVQSNTSLHQKIIAPYPSNPRMAPPQGLWLQSPLINVLPRPPLLSYPSTFPGSFPLPVHGMPLPFFALPDSRPPGLTHIGAPGVTSILPAASGSQLAIGSLVQPELPPGSDNSKHVNDAAVPVEQLNEWSAHKTEGGALYYYNAFTGESTYQKPSGFKGELDKVTTQTTPVSWEKCAGTDWSLVTTNDGKRYFYNTNTKLSSWQIPTEVTESRRKQNDEAMKEQSSSLPDTNNSTGKGSAAVSLSAPAVTTGGRDATALRILGVPGSSSALDLIKKKLQESGAPSTSSSLPPLSVAVPTELNGSVEVAVKGPHSENGKDKMKDANADANLSDSSSDSEDVDIGPSKEECAIQFKEMLKERGVAPFSKWEKELPKFVFDPRFKAIPGYSARRALFEHYVRTRAEEERKEKRAAQKAAIEGYKQLLEEAKEDIDHKTDYQTFKKKWGHDPRFVALDRKEREVQLNERVRPLKRCAEEEARAIREATASTFISMLRDKGDITTGSRWSKVKDTLRNDPRYKSVKHEDREVLFNEYISKLKSAEEDAERVAKEKRDEEEKLKERERALRKRKEREEQEVERVRSKARRKEAIESYQALLVETIKDPQVSWTDSKPKLEKDPQGRAANPNLDKSDLEKLFREHVKMLHDRCAHDFRALLAEVITGATALEENEEGGGKTPLTSWSTAKRLLKADPRYAKMPRKERESLWGRYVEEMERKQKIIVDPQDLEKKHTDKRSSVDIGKYRSGSRRNNERR